MHFATSPLPLLRTIFLLWSSWWSLIVLANALANEKAEKQRKNFLCNHSEICLRAEFRQWEVLDYLDFTFASYEGWSDSVLSQAPLFLQFPKVNPAPANTLVFKTLQKFYIGLLIFKQHSLSWFLRTKQFYSDLQACVDIFSRNHTAAVAECFDISRFVDVLVI